jgi:hypothetical protein
MLRVLERVCGILLGSEAVFDAVKEHALGELQRRVLKIAFDANFLTNIKEISGVEQEIGRILPSLGPLHTWSDAYFIARLNDRAHWLDNLDDKTEEAVRSARHDVAQTLRNIQASS